MNRSASLTTRLADCSALCSTDPFLRSEPGEQDSDPALGGVKVFFAPPQRCTEIGQFCVQGLALTVASVVAHVGAPGWLDLYQAFGGEYADGGLGRVQRNPVGIPELPVRRYPAARWACPAADLGPENIGEPMARKSVQSLRHTATITDRLKTDTHCRQRVGAGFTAPDDHCPRAAGARPERTSPWPAHRCPFCGTDLDGGPVVFWCARCGCGIQAADLDVEYRPLGQDGRAV